MEPIVDLTDAEEAELHRRLGGLLNFYRRKAGWCRAGLAPVRCVVGKGVAGVVRREGGVYGARDEARGWSVGS